MEGFLGPANRSGRQPPGYHLRPELGGKVWHWSQRQERKAGRRGFGGRGRQRRRDRETADTGTGPIKVSPRRPGTAFSGNTTAAGAAVTVHGARGACDSGSARLRSARVCACQRARGSHGDGDHRQDQEEHCPEPVMPEGSHQLSVARINPHVGSVLSAKPHRAPGLRPRRSLCSGYGNGQSPTSSVAPRVGNRNCCPGISARTARSAGGATLASPA
jgi:hypothetical protein